MGSLGIPGTGYTAPGGKIVRHLLYSLLLMGLSGCASQWASQQDSYAGDDGSTMAVIEITSSPTSAWIFIDGVYVGATPIEMEMSFGAGTSYLEVAAVPIHDSQSRQVKRIKVPPLPKSIHFLMNNLP